MKTMPECSFDVKLRFFNVRNIDYNNNNDDDKPDRNICKKATCNRINITLYSFIHSGYFCSAASNPLLLRGAPDTAQILCRSFAPKHHRQLRAKDLLKASRPLRGG